MLEDNLITWMIFVGVSAIAIGIFLIVISREKRIDQTERDDRMFHEMEEVLNDLQGRPEDG